MTGTHAPAHACAGHGLAPAPARREGWRWEATSGARLVCSRPDRREVWSASSEEVEW